MPRRTPSKILIVRFEVVETSLLSYTCLAIFTIELLF